MKNVILVCILSIAVTFTAGCASQEDTNPVSQMPSLSPPSIDKTQSFTIYRPPVDDFSRFEHLQQWYDIIKEKFDVDIQIDYISPLHQSGIATADYYPGAIKEGEICGIIELNVGDYVNIAVLKDAGLILPIDEYLKSNEIYKTLPGAMKSAFVLPDGKTWAISTQSLYGIYSRNLKKEWLDNLRLFPPTTLDQLYEVSKAFAYEDPNKNGVADEHGMDINLRTSARMLTDIFTANDCFLSNYSSCSISYDPSTGAYEDAVLKPGMTESLQYIKMLSDEGILHINMNFDFRERDGFGNYYDLSAFFPADDEDWEKIYTLNPTKDYPTVRALKPDSCFVITSNVEDPGSVLNSFINTFLGSSEGMAMGLFGVPGLNYSAQGNTITQLTGFTTSDSLQLTGMNVNLLERENITIESSFIKNDILTNMKIENTLIEDLFSRNMLITDSWFLPHLDYKSAQRGFSSSFYNYIVDISSVSPRDFIDNYRKKALEAGYDKILDDLNNEAGILASYSYGN